MSVRMSVMKVSQRYADRYGRVIAGSRVSAADRKGAIASIMEVGIVGVLTLAIAVCSFLMFGDAASAAGDAIPVPGPMGPVLLGLIIAGLLAGASALRRKPVAVRIRREPPRRS